MNYLVKVWWMPKGKRCHTDFHEFRTAEEANDYADWKAEQFRKGVYEFDISIYQRIE